MRRIDALIHHEHTDCGVSSNVINLHYKKIKQSFSSNTDNLYPTRTTTLFATTEEESMSRGGKVIGIVPYSYPTVGII